MTTVDVPAGSDLANYWNQYDELLLEPGASYPVPSGPMPAKSLTIRSTAPTQPAEIHGTLQDQDVIFMQHPSDIVLEGIDFLGGWRSVIITAGAPASRASSLVIRKCVVKGQSDATKTTKWGVIAHGTDVRLEEVDGSIFEEHVAYCHNADSVEVVRCTIGATGRTGVQVVGRANENDGDPCGVVLIEDTSLSGTGSGAGGGAITLAGVRFARISRVTATPGASGSCLVCSADYDPSIGKPGLPVGVVVVEDSTFQVAAGSSRPAIVASCLALALERTAISAPGTALEWGTQGGGVAGERFPPGLCHLGPGTTLSGDILMPTL